MKKTLLFIVFVLILLTASYFFFAKKHSAYKSKSECKIFSGKQCNPIMCDYIPEGKTVKETCGKDFVDGYRWVPLLN